MADGPAERRGFAAVAGGGVACCALAAVAAARPWVDVQAALRNAGGAAVSSTLAPFAQSAPALALALVALASWGVLLVVRGRARTVVAVVGVLFGAGLLAVCVAGFWQVPDAVRQAISDQLGTPAGTTGRLALPHTGWYWLALVCAAGSVATLGIAVRAAHRWPAMGARYDAPGHVPAGERDLWRSLDEGNDPTDPGSA